MEICIHGKDITNYCTLCSKQIENDNLSEEHKIIIGERIASILLLREDRGYTPKRYKTTWGNKTALGIYGTVKRLIEE